MSQITNRESVVYVCQFVFLLAITGSVSNIVGKNRHDVSLLVLFGSMVLFGLPICAFSDRRACRFDRTSIVAATSDPGSIAGNRILLTGTAQERTARLSVWQEELTDLLYNLGTRTHEFNVRSTHVQQPAAEPPRSPKFGGSPIPKRKQLLAMQQSVIGGSAVFIAMQHEHHETVALLERAASGEEIPLPLSLQNSSAPLKEVSERSEEAANGSG